MRALTMSGAVLVCIGLIALMIPVLMTQKTTDVARIGDLKLQTTEDRYYIIPPLLSGGVLLLGGILIAASFYRRP